MDTLTVITAATIEPVTLDEVKNHLRLSSSSSEEDALLTALIGAARGHVEARTGRVLMETTLERVMDGFPSAPYEIHPAPLLSVTSVTYLDADGDSTVFSSDDYRVETYAGPTCRPGVISLGYGEEWPTPQAIVRNVRLRFKAGYLTTTATSATAQRAAVPAELRQAILFLVAEMYERRTVATTGTIVIPNLFTVEALCGPFVLYGWCG